jgi:hypothetical protein
MSNTNRQNSNHRIERLVSDLLLIIIYYDIVRNSAQKAKKARVGHPYTKHVRIEAMLPWIVFSDLPLFMYNNFDNRHIFGQLLCNSDEVD